MHGRPLSVSAVDRIAFVTSASPLRIAVAGSFLGLQLIARAAEPAAVAFDVTPQAGQYQRQLLDMQVTTTTRLVAAPNANEEERARIAQAQQQNPQGPVKMSLRVEQTQRVGQPDDRGWLPLTLSSTSKGGDIELGGKKRALPQDKKLDLLVQARFNPKDHAFDLQQVLGGGDADEQLRTKGAAMVTEALQLPKALGERPLKVGDSVDVPMKMALPFAVPDSDGQMNSKLRYTLKRVDKGIAHFDLSMDMQIQATAPLPAASEASDAAAPQTMNLQLSGSGKGSSTLRLADRLPLSSLLNLDVRMAMQAPDNGRVLMSMRMQMKSKGESLAKPAAAKKKP